MNSAPPRPVLRDRSNDDDFATKTLIRGFIDRPVQGGKNATTPPSTSSSTSGGTAFGDSPSAPASAPGAPATAVQIITPTFSRPGVVDAPAASRGGISTGASQTTTLGSAAAACTQRQRRRQLLPRPDRTRPRPPPPVACTLVAFEPGSLGLELEAIVDEGARRAERQGEQEQRRSVRRPKRLGCRVFRVTPDGQAARHGSVHPGDALVVLDGVDVLSDPFDDITRALLERQGRRRLIGFMGAATVAASVPQKRRTRSSSSFSSMAVSGTAPSEATRGDTAALKPASTITIAPPSVPVADSQTERSAAAAAAAAGDRQEEKKRNERSRRRQRTEVETGGESVSVSGRLGGEDSGGGGDRAAKTSSSGRHVVAGGSGEEERGRQKDGEAAPPNTLNNHCRGRSFSFGSLPSRSKCDAVEREWREAELIPHPRDGTKIHRRPAEGGTTGPRRLEGNHSYTEIEQRVPGAGTAVTDPSATVEGDGGRRAERGRSGVWTGYDSSAVMGRSLGSSWGSCATTGRLATPAGETPFVGGRPYRARPLDGSRGESLQRSLAEAIEDKSALAAERAWLLEELQRAREATLERDGALAGQEVQTDVLKMEVSALEGELRRARQELGACEAGRRELHEAAKRDLARRDRDAADLSAALRRERDARERDADDAAAAAARAAERAADKAAAAGRSAADMARRRAESAEARAAESEERREEAEATARAAVAEAAVEAAEAVRRERERREMEVREREEEISALLLRVEASESRARRLVEDKAEQLREVEEAAVKSLEAAERRRAEWEDKVSAIAARLREREAENTRKDRLMKELESRLGRARVQASEMEEKKGTEVRRVTEELEAMRKALSDREASARGEAERLATRLRDEEKKTFATTARLRALEQRARLLETGAIAARQRAEAGTRKEKEVSERLAEMERERACQEVSVTTLRAQLEELRRGAVAGEAASREAAKLKKILKKILERVAAQHFGTHPSDPATAAAAAIDGARMAASDGVIDESGEGERRIDKRRGGADEGRAGPVGGDGLVELAEQLQRRMEETGRELENVREALKTAREETHALQERDKDAAELRSLLEQKRGVSSQLARGAKAARARAKRAERDAEAVRAEGASLRAELEAAREQADAHGKRAECLQENVSELGAEVRALATRVSEEKEAAAKARADLAVAADRVSPLEEALDELGAEKADVVRRLTQKDGDVVALQAHLEETLAELEAVKLALFEASKVGGVGGGRVPREAVVQTLPREDVAGAHAEAAAAGNAEIDTLKRQHAEVLEESRLARSELASVHLRTRMCGARVLSAVLQKWAARQAARAFWRLRMAIRRAAAGERGAASSCALCSAAGNRQNGSPTCDDGLSPMMLTIQAPTPTIQGGGGGDSGWASPRVSPPGSDNSDGERERQRPRHTQDDSCPKVASPAARHRRRRDGSRGDGDGGFLQVGTTTNAPLAAPDGDGGTWGQRPSRRSRQGFRERCSPPPPSPASSQARNRVSPPEGSFGFARSSGDTDVITPVTSTPVSAISGIVGGGSGFTNPESADDTEQSFFSTASSEPRYHCLPSGLSSPAGSFTGSWTGIVDEMMPLDVSEAPSGEDCSGAVRYELVVINDDGRGERSEQDGSDGVGRERRGFSEGGGGVTSGNAKAGFEFGVEVSVGSSDSWWELSEEELEV